MKREPKESKLTQDDIKRYTSIFWKALIGIVLFAVLFLTSVRIGVFGKLPSFEDLEKGWAR